VRFDGLLSHAFRQQGSVQEAAALVAAAGSCEGCLLLDPVPGTCYAPPTR
jgi:hypothetical protein